MHRPALLVVALLASTAPAQPPAAPKRPVTDTYHGVEVIDNYRWLEIPDDPEVKAWSDAQNAAARKVLDALPNRAAISARVEQIMTAPTVRFSSLHAAGTRLLAMRMEPSRQQPVLVAFDDLNAVISGDASVTPRIVLDPAAFDPSHKTTIDWYAPSPDGNLVAVSLSSSGTESGDIHIFSAADGKQVFEVVPRAQGGTAGGSLAWTPDSKGFYYTRYPRTGERPKADMDFYVQVYHHTLGEPTEKDRFEMGKDLPRIAEIVLEVQHEGKAAGTVLASVQKGDGGEFIHFLRDHVTGSWRQFTKYDDRIVQAVLGPDDAVHMVSRKDAPRGKLVRMTLAEPALASATTVVPEGSDTIVSEFFEASNIVVTERLVYATYQLGGPSEVRLFSHDGTIIAKPSSAPVSSVGGLTPLKLGAVLFHSTSFITPSTWVWFDPPHDSVDARTLPPDSPGRKPRTGVVAALTAISPADFSPYETVREFAASKDGTNVPVNIVRRKGLKLDGSHPTLVTGYGGYGVNIEPYFSAADIALLEQGFVLATANIRGGGEFGDAWHYAGNLDKKQNVFDDFAAACQHMIDAKYTSPSRLAIEGGSNGGLLMGAMLTQHPEMFRAVVSHVGIYDMLRVELSPNGAFNIPEFGTVKDEKLFKAMYAYSPYHRVKDGTAYPATLFLTGANDPRVDPMQSRKMIARLQAATNGVASAGPILLRTSGDTGHGAGTPLKERIAQTADVDAFLFDRLGVGFKPVTK
ncbi:MAG: S9 family peptidase [Phycisphaerales bacterium]|nr:S9 family peptidase [Phycisphaerales bacterium]